MDTKVSLIIPCLNEEESIAFCIAEATSAFRTLGISGQILVIDNGSSDASAALAKKAGAQVIELPAPSYGDALTTGFGAAEGDYIITGDADGSHIFSAQSLQSYIDAIDRGVECVVGNRFAGRIEKNSMKCSHFVANHILSWLFSLRHGVRLHDVTCGMRGFKKSSLCRLSFAKKGLEFNIEILSVFAQSGAKMAEVPTDMRARLGGKSKLSPFKDGMKHFIAIFATPAPKPHE